MSTRSHFIGGRWMEGAGPELSSQDPATGETTWEGKAASDTQVDQAVGAAKEAFDTWAAQPVSSRLQVLEAYRDEVRSHREVLAEAISRETGKPRWEALGEADAMAAKVDLSAQAYEERCSAQRLELADAVGTVHYRPHGVMAVLGPFNLPGHLPNGHIVPALLAGNTVVFKPSELTPLVAEIMVGLWERAGLPGGVLNLVQGAGPTGRSLAEHPRNDGLLFTGSYRVGRAIHEAFGGHPEKILALEMGGNSPLVVWDVEDLDAAALTIVLSAFITAGQRCTCSRRLVVPEVGSEELVDRLVQTVGRIRVGRHTERPEPFMGPVISRDAADRLGEAQRDLLRRGASSVLEMTRLGGAFVSPGLADVTGLPDRPDEELFGPILQLVRVRDFDAAVREANHTEYGLSAGILTDDPNLYEQFRARVRAGVVTWNRPTTGASGRLPFGGVGKSGNHRPSGYHAVDYCADPVATLEVERLRTPAKMPPGLGGEE